MSSKPGKQHLFTPSASPVFLLRGINFGEIWRLYQEGAFQTIAPSSSIKVVDFQPFCPHSHGADATSATYTFKDRHNATVVIATGNHENYSYYLKDGRLDSSVCRRCDFCKVDFEGMPIGIPLAMEERISPLPAPAPLPASPHDVPGAPDAQSPSLDAALTRLLQHKGTPGGKIIHIFWTEGEYCTFECALGDLRRFLLLPLGSQDVCYQNSEYLLKFLFRLSYPAEEKTLLPSLCPRLLKSNMGPLEEKEWRNPRHSYNRTATVHLAPAKVEYIRAIV